MNHLKKFENFLNESDINDPVLILSRANKEQAKKNKEDQKKRLAKRVYGKKREELESQVWDINLQIKDLYAEKREIFKEQDIAAGQKGEAWSDDDANVYGEKLNLVDDQIAELLIKRSQIETKLAY